MIAIPGMAVTAKIYESVHSIVYRGIREQDNQPVILKLLKQDYTTPAELTRYKQEYEIARSLNLEGAIKAYSLQSYQRSLVIILEDFGGSSLKALTNSRNLTLDEFLQIAIKIAESLGLLHSANVIHKDINPSNIVFNPETGQLKIIDFGISTALTREDSTLKNPNVLEGTLAYISPEQTGRMNRSLDYRTDFYSLGVAFYELLAGQLPFQTTDAMELVHCHIAKQPVPPDKINSAIPKVVSDIVMKLLAKTAEERYQSAWGIQADLILCLMQLEANDEIEDFPIGENDYSDKFQIPQKLYGREREIAALMTAFERDRRQTEMILVSGYSGIGKSVLVQELYKPITEKRGYFISGKFDPFGRNIPYSAIVSALRELVGQLLAESQAQLKEWREKLLTAFSGNGQVIIDVIPEVELIVDKQPPLPELGQSESQNRFNLVFQNFIRAFCSKEHPLVIFLDDLQWADSATLKLIELIMTDAEEPYLFLIGAYRDNEVNPTHPLMMALKNLQKEGEIVNQIALASLEIEDITQLIAETLHNDSKTVRSLAELVARKTGGNPFFVNEFLKILHAEGLIIFDRDRLGWQWNIERIQERNITDNVVELTMANLKKLPDATQQVLSLAACWGVSFDLHALSIICEQSPASIFSDLGTALQSGLILPTSEMNSDLLIIDYKFLHERVQQAAYALIDEAQKQNFHLKIGRLLLNNTRAESLSDKLFEIVDHLNIGIELVADRSERDEIARLNLRAGQKSKAATTYATALSYLKVGIGLLAADSWQNNQYNLTLNLYIEAVETAYLNGEFEEMEKFAEVAIARGKTLLDKIKVYEIKILACQVQSRQLEAIAIGLQVLKLLGITFPDSPSQQDIQTRIEETKSNLTEKGIENLINLPVMTAPDKLAALRILASVYPPIFQAAPELLPLIICEKVNLSIAYGNAPLSAFAYALYGLILCGVVGDIECGSQFEKLSLSLLEKFNAKELEAKIFEIIGGHIRHWKQHCRETLNLLKNGYRSGLENGDIEFAGYCGWTYCYHLYFTGKQLAQLEREMATYSQAIGQLKQKTTLSYLETYRQVVLNLMGSSSNLCLLVGEAYNEKTRWPQLIKANDKNGLNMLYLHKFMLYYLFQNYKKAIEYAEKAEKSLDGATAMLLVPVFYFYDSLARLAAYGEAEASEREKILDKVRSNQIKMQEWANRAPMNHLHKFYLVEAELHRVLGENVEAMETYDRAIALAKENDYIQEEAIANELAAKFYMGWGKEKIARAYLTDAHYCYTCWGAKAKVEDLEKRYPQFITYVAPSSRLTDASTITTLTSTSSRSGETLDLAAVMKASQAISGEILLDKLLAKLMKILIENSGAEIGYLILSTNGQLLIEASGEVDCDSLGDSRDVPCNVSTASRPIALPSIPIENNLPVSVINYVARTQENIVLDEAIREDKFTNDPYIKEHQTKSILCAPLLNQGQLSGIIYLENNLTTGVFTSDRLEVIKLLSGQAAIAISHAKLYAELRQSESKLTQFLEAVPVGIAVHNPNGEVSYINETGQHILGQGARTETTSEELSSAYQIYKAGTLDPYPSEQMPALRALQGEKALVDDMELHREGKIIPLEVRSQPIFDELGKIIYSINAFQDISDRKQTEKLLSEYNRTLELQVAERTGELKSALDHLKATQEELIHSEKMAALGQLVAGVAHEINTPLGAIRSSIENIADFLMKNLSKLPIFFQQISSERSEDFLALLQKSSQPNISLTSREKRQIRKCLQRQLELLSLEDSDTIASTLVDIGLVDEIEPFLLLLQDPDSDNILQMAYQFSTVQKSTRTIITATERAAKVVFALKSYARYDHSGEKVQAKITEGIETILTLYHNQLKQGVEVVKNYAANLPAIACYPDELNQVWTNLIHNALQAMDYQGTLSIDVTEQDKNIRVSISDTGKGIPPEIRPKIFDPFFTTKPTGEGSGLGLDIVKKIVDKHNGKIEVDSVPGQTTFTALLPINLNLESSDV